MSNKVTHIVEYSYGTIKQTERGLVFAVSYSAAHKACVSENENVEVFQTPIWRIYGGDLDYRLPWSGDVEFVDSLVDVSLLFSDNVTAYTQQKDAGAALITHTGSLTHPHLIISMSSRLDGMLCASDECNRRLLEKMVDCIRLMEL